MPIYLLYLLQVMLAVFWLRLVSCEVLPTVSSADDISQINNLRSDEPPRVSIDPRLRRALLRVLTKLEEEDRNGDKQESVRQMNEVMQNAISEEDFIKYFEEHGLEKELLNTFENNEPINTEEQKGIQNVEEILSYSSEDSKKEREQPFTFASYPKDNEEETTPNTKQITFPDFLNKEKYPSTNPTPSLGDAIYFQIPEPVHIIDEGEDHNDDQKSSRDVQEQQEQRDILESNSDSEKDNKDFDIEEELPQEEQQVRFVELQESEKETIQEESSTSSIKEEEYKKDHLPQLEEDQPKTQVVLEASNSTEVESSDGLNNSSMKVKLEKHEVEFLHAPLLAAFTVQQDQQGLPRRVIPLNYLSSGDPITLPNNKVQEQHISTNKNSLAEKQHQLEQQVKFLQEQQLQEQQYRRLQEFVRQRQKLLEEEAQRQLVLDNQKLQYESEQRLALARQRQQQILFSNQQENQLQTLKELETQRYYQHQNRIPQNIDHQNINFQKSVDFQYQPTIRQPSSFPQPLHTFQPSFNTFNSPFQQPVELNRVNRHEPSNSIGNFVFSTPSPPAFNFHTSGRSTVQQYQQPTAPTYFQQSNFIQPPHQHRFSQPSNFDVTRPPISLDGQLQSLLSISGIAGGLRGKPSAQEDLNIVSKVLALGHGEHQFQASSNHEQVVEPPSRVIEPPKL